MYCKGLKDDIKDKFIRYGGTVSNLEELIEAAYVVSDRLYERN
jgi:hypothetical protein